MDIYKRLAYLHQVQNLLNEMSESKKALKNKDERKINKKKDVNKTQKCQQQQQTSPKAQSQNGSLVEPFVKLNSFFGHLSKEIAMKHNIQILNCDQMRQFRCKRCFCQYNFHQMTQSLSNVNPNEPKMIKLEREKSGKYLKLLCPQCGFRRKIIFSKQIKTKFERVCAELKQTQQQRQPNRQKESQNTCTSNSKSTSN